MLNSVATRIQTRLKRQGVKVVLGEIKEYLKSTVSNINDITKQEETNTTDYFINNASQLVVISNDDINTDVMTVDNGDILEQGKLTSIDSINTDVMTTENEAASEAIAQEYTKNIPLLQNNTLATTTKNELVANTANSLGITLNTSEIELIAENVNYSSDDLQETLGEIKTAIIAFIQHKIATNSELIDSTLNEIVQVATDGFNANSHQLTEGLKTINKQLQEQSTDFKSKVKASLKCFQLPAAS